MIHPEFAEDARLLVRTCQILVLALAAGCVMFLGIAALSHHGFPLLTAPNEPEEVEEKAEPKAATAEAKEKGGDVPAEEDGSTKLTYFLLAAIVPLLVARAIVPKLYAETAIRHIVQEEDFLKVNPSGTASLAQFLIKKHGEAGQLAQVYLTRTLLAAALLEAPALMAIMAYFLEGETPALIAAAVLIVLLLLLWPTTTGFVDWVLEELRKFSDHRQFERPEPLQ